MDRVMSPTQKNMVVKPMKQRIKMSVGDIH